MPFLGSEPKARLASSPRQGEWVNVDAGGGDQVDAFVVYPERRDRAPDFLSGKTPNGKCSDPDGRRSEAHQISPRFIYQSSSPTARACICSICVSREELFYSEVKEPTPRQAESTSCLLLRLANLDYGSGGSAAFMPRWSSTSVRRVRSSGYSPD